MNQKLHNNKGSAMIWVLVLCVIFGILGVAIGWVALSMNKRSVTNYILKQDYFTSRSAVDTTLNELNGWSGSGDYSNSYCNYLNTNLINGNKHIEITDYFGAKNSTTEVKQMGSCTLTGNYTRGVVTFNAVTGDGTDGKVSLTAARTSTQQTWPNSLWASELTASNDALTVGASADAFKDADVAVYKVSSGKQSGKLTITKDAQKEKKAIFIYVQPGATLEITGMAAANPGGVTSGADNSVEKWFDSGNTFDWSGYYGPDIFIYLNGGDTSKATLNFTNYAFPTDQSQPYPVYIAGTGTSSTSVTSSQSSISVFYYQDVSSTILKYNQDSDKAPTHLPISGYYYTGAPATGSETGLNQDVWSVLKYTNGE
jgi:hypothetical protein